MKRRSKTDILLYGVALVQCVFLGMAALLAVLSGPLIRTSMRAENARDQLLNQLPKAIVIIENENTTNTQRNPNEIATISVAVASSYSFLQLIGILILFRGLYTRSHCSLLAFFAWCLISNALILGALIFGTVRVAQLKKEPLPPPPRLGLKIPPISDLIDQLGDTSRILDDIFGKKGLNIDINQNPEEGDFLSRFISPFLNVGKQTSNPEADNSNPLLNLFNALTGEGSQAPSGERLKRADPKLPPGAPRLPPPPSLPFGSQPIKLPDFLPKEGTVVPLPGIELPPVIEDFIYDSMDEAFCFLIGFTVAKAVAALYSLLATLIAATRFRRLSNSIINEDGMEMKRQIYAK